MRLPHRLQGQKVKSQGGAGAYCGGDLAAQLVNSMTNSITNRVHHSFTTTTTVLKQRLYSIYSRQMEYVSYALW